MATDGRKRGKKKTIVLTTALVEKISLRCSSLKTLHLCGCDLQAIPLKLFPTQHLEALYVHKCTITETFCLHNCVALHSWFEVVDNVQERKESILPNLITLSLHQSTVIGDGDLLQISYLTQLKHLDLSGCYQINNYGFIKVCEGLRGLLTLNISWCSLISDFSMRRIGQCLKQLQILGMRNLQQVTNVGISYIANGLSHLEMLDMSECICVTDPAVFEIAQKLSHLKEMNVSFCHLTEQCVATLPLLLPSCDIIAIKQS